PQAASAGLGCRPPQHPLSGQQPTAALAGDVGLFADGTSAHDWLSGDRTGPGNGGHPPVETLQSGRPSPSERASGVRPDEQRLSLGGPVPMLPWPLDGLGAVFGLSKPRGKTCPTVSGTCRGRWCRPIGLKTPPKQAARSLWEAWRPAGACPGAIATSIAIFWLQKSLRELHCEISGFNGFDSVWETVETVSRLAP